MYISCRFFTKLPTQYKIPNDPINIATTLTISELSNIINNYLTQIHHQPFDFLFNGKYVYNIQHLVNENNLYSEVLQLEYILAFVPPNLHSKRILNDWVSAVSGLLDKDLFVVSGCYDGKLSFFGSKNNKSIFTAHNGPITAINLTKNSSTLNLVTASKDKTANLWSINPKYDSLTLLAIMEGSDGAIHTSSRSPSGQSLAVGGWDCRIRLFETSSFTDKKKATHTSSPTMSKKEVYNFKKIVKPAGRTQSAVPVIRPIASTGLHKDCVTGLSWSSETSFFSGSIDRSLRKWDLGAFSKPVCSNTLISSKAINCIATRPVFDENIVAFGCTDNSLRIWDSRCEAKKGKIKLQSFSSHCGWVSNVAWRPNSEFMLASGSYDGSIKIWDLRTNSPLTTINEAHKGKILSMSWISQGMLVSGGTDCELKLLKF